MDRMSRRTRLLAVLVALACGWPAARAFGEAVGSPSSLLEKGEWDMGVSGGGTFGRTMKSNGKVTMSQFGHARGYGLTNWLSLYGKIGAAFLSVEDPSLLHPDGATQDFGGGYLWMAQAKVRFWRSRRTGIEWDGSAQFVDARFKHRNKNDGTWHEWVLATSVAKAMGRYKPYLGIKSSLVNLDAKVRRNGEHFAQPIYEQDSLVGGFLGTDIYFGESKDVIINVEGDYADGPEVNVALKYLF